MDTGSQTLAASDFHHLSPKKNEFVPDFIPSGRKFLRAQIFVIFVNYKVITILFHGNLGVPRVLLNTETRAEY